MPANVTGQDQTLRNKHSSELNTFAMYICILLISDIEWVPHMPSHI